MAERELSARLVAALTEAGVAPVTDRDVVAGHGVDWTGRWRGEALGLLRPADAGQIVGVLDAARAAGVPVQVQGGNTGLVGGSVPGPPSLLLSTARLTQAGRVDRLERTIVVGGGVTCAEVSRLAESAGLAFGIDLASRDSATVGGMAATNAGGMGVIAHGHMREQVRGLRAVLADGRIIDTIGRPRKDNVGYDLTGLMVGSEGTLGVITDIEIGLIPRPGRVLTGLAGVHDLAGAVRLTRLLEDSGCRILAAEVVDPEGLAGAAHLLGVANPLAGASSRWALLIDVTDGSGSGFEPIGEEILAAADTATERHRLWELRHRQSEVHALRSGAGLVKLDLAVRLDQLDDLVAAVRRVADEHGAEVGFFGHALDGNLHVQVHPGAEQGGSAETAAAAILGVVVTAGGFISAEHGLGRQKAHWLELVRSADHVALMRQIKEAVDPQGLLNPGVLFSDRRAARGPLPDGS